MGIEPPEIDADAMETLLDHNFPGNVCELKNIVERALIESGGEAVRNEHLYLFSKAASVKPLETSSDVESNDDIPMNLLEAEEVLIDRALKQTDGNIAAAARLLGTNRPMIYKFLQNKEGSDSS